MAGMACCISKHLTVRTNNVRAYAASGTAKLVHTKTRLMGLKGVQLVLSSTWRKFVEAVARMCAKIEGPLEQTCACSRPHTLLPSASLSGTCPHKFVCKNTLSVGIRHDHKLKCSGCMHKAVLTSQTPLLHTPWQLQQPSQNLLPGPEHHPVAACVAAQVGDKKKDVEEYQIRKNCYRIPFSFL